MALAWQRKSQGAQQIRESCERRKAPLFVNCRGQLLHQRWLLTTILFIGKPWDQPRYREAAGLQRAALPGVERVARRHRAGHVWTKSLQVARSRLSRHAGSARGRDCGSRKTPRLWRAG